MNSFGFVVALALAAVVAVSGEPPVRYQQFSRGFGRLQQAPVFARQTAGYDYPKPAAYYYPQPEQPFPLPEELPTTTVEPSTTVAPTTTEMPTTTAAVDDYDDSTTVDPESETVEAEARAIAARLRSARLRQAPRNNRVSARLEDLDSQLQQDQNQQRPIYLVNIPESTLQRLALLNQAQPAVAAVPAAVPAAFPAAAQLQVAAPLQPAAVAPAPLPFAPRQVYFTDYGLVYAKK